MTGIPTWFTRRPDDSASRRLFCLPFAGGGASIYRDWPAAFESAGVEVLPVQLPGRESRVAEPPAFDTDDVARVISELADRPYAIFGHSMGGRLAYDVTRSLLLRGVRAPDLVVVSASRPPHLPRTGSLDGISTFSDAKLTARLRRSGSIPEAVLAEPDLMDILLPVLRADFTWIDALEVHEPKPVPVPLLALAGALDRAVSHEQAAQWRDHTSGSFGLHLLPGDHFFLRDHLDQIRAAILGRWGPGESDSPVVPEQATTHHADRRPGPHHTVLGDNLLWTEGAVRSAGFPISGLRRLNSTTGSVLTERFLSGELSEAEWATAFADALEESATEVESIAADPIFQEALAWQSPTCLGIARDIAAGVTSSTRRRRRNLQLMARYWQRYCAKNDTIGFFGPLAHARLAPESATRITPGESLIGERRTLLECWAIRAVADTIFADPRTRALLAPRLAWNVVLDAGTRRAAVPPRSPVDISALELQALTLVDGSTAAQDLFVLLGLSPRTGTALLSGLQDHGLLFWGPDVPQDPTAQDWLTTTLDRLAGHATLDDARTAWSNLLAAVDSANESSGSADATDKSLRCVRDAFTTLTGKDSNRSPGQTYAGREVLYQDTLRDVEITIGGDVLHRIDRQLRLMTRAARWWCAEVGAAYEVLLDEIFTEVAGADGVVPLSELWLVALNATVGAGETPADEVEAEFARRWNIVLGLDDDPPSPAQPARSLDLAHVEVLVEQQFPDRPLRWSGARVHSPDLQIAATDEDALRAGEFTVVLGEWHSGMATLDNASFVQFLPDPDTHKAALRADLGGPVIRPLLPPEWARNTGRLTTFLHSDGDAWLAFTETAPRPGADIVQLTEVEVRRDDAGRLVARTRTDGRDEPREWHLLEMLSSLLSIRTVDGFRHLTHRPYTPRISIGQLVLTRRTWRMTAGSVPLSRAEGIAQRFAEARRWRAANDFPEEVFVSVASETKPLFVDFRSPWLVAALATTLVSCRRSLGDDGSVVVSEMLPAPDECWLIDHEGRTYCSELRVQVTDAV